MMDHNHSPHPGHTVERVNAPQSVGVDAAAGVAQDGGFCGPVGLSVHFEHASTLGWVGRRHGNREREEKTKNRTSGF